MKEPQNLNKPNRDLLQVFQSLGLGCRTVWVWVSWLCISVRFSGLRKLALFFPWYHLCWSCVGLPGLVYWVLATELYLSPSPLEHIGMFRQNAVTPACELGAGGCLCETLNPTPLPEAAVLCSAMCCTSMSKTLHCIAFQCSGTFRRALPILCWGFLIILVKPSRHVSSRTTV